MDFSKNLSKKKKKYDFSTNSNRFSIVSYHRNTSVGKSDVGNVYFTMFRACARQIERHIHPARLNEILKKKKPFRGTRVI